MQIGLQIVMVRTRVNTNRWIMGVVTEVGHIREAEIVCT